MNARDRVLSYRKQAGVSLDKPYILTPKQRRRVKQKTRAQLPKGVTLGSMEGEV